MPRFAANLSLMYTELPFMDRFAAAASDGFVGVEYLFPYAWPAAELAARLADHSLQQVLFNAPPAGVDRAAMVNAWEQGARGTACLPGREAEFRDGVELALTYAHTMQSPRLHVMAGCPSPEVPVEQVYDTYLENLTWAAAMARPAGVELLIEPLNTRDVPDYFLTHQAQAHAVVQAVGADNLKVQMDLYHCQIMEGDVATKLRQYLPGGAVGHIQIAGVPERHEPDTGELHYPYLFEVIDSLAYPGWIGCEYRPRLGQKTGATRAGLGWLPKAADRGMMQGF